MDKVTVQAEVTGLVFRVEFAEGEEVSAGDTVVVLESMKMEIPVATPTGGRITEVLVKPGDAVEEGTALFEVES